MPTQVAEAYLTLSASTQQLVQDLAGARALVGSSLAGIGGIWRTTWGALTDLGTIIGGPFTASLNLLGQMAATTGSVLSTAIGSGLQAARTLGSASIAALRTSLASLPAMLPGLLGSLSALGGMLRTSLASIPAVLPGILSALGALGSMLLTTLAGPVELVVGTVIATFLGMETTFLRVGRSLRDIGSNFLIIASSAFRLSLQLVGLGQAGSVLIQSFHQVINITRSVVRIIQDVTDTFLALLMGPLAGLKYLASAFAPLGNILAFAFVGGINALQRLGMGLRDVWDNIKAIGGSAYALTFQLFGIGNSLSGMVNVFGELGNIIKNVWGIGRILVSTLISLAYAPLAGIEYLHKAFSQLGSTFGFVFSGAWTVLSGLGAALYQLGTITASLFGGALDVVMGIVTSLIGALPALLSAIGQLVSGIFEAIKSLAQGAVQILQNLLSVASAIANRLVSFFAGFASSVLKPVLGALQQNIFDIDPGLQMAMQAEQRTAKMAAMLHGTGEAAGWSAGQLRAMRDDVAGLGGVTKSEVEKAQTVLLRFGELRGEQYQQALFASRQLAALMETEMTSAAMTLGRALESPATGMMMLRRAGILLDEPTKEMIKQRQEAGDLAGAQEVLIRYVSRYGDVAGAMANTVTGRLKSLSSAWAGISKAVGEAFLPLVDILARFVQPLVQGISESVRSVIGGLASNSQGLMDQAKTWIDDNKGQIVAWGHMIGETVGTVFTFVRDVFAWLGKQVVDLFAWMSGDAAVEGKNIQDAITGSLAVLETVIQNFPTAWNVAWAAIKVGWAMLIDHLKMVWEQFGVWVQGRAKIMSAKVGEFFLPGGEIAREFLGDPVAANIRGMELDLRSAMRRVQTEWKPDEQIQALQTELTRMTDEFKAKAQANIAKARQTPPPPPGTPPRPNMVPNPAPIDTSTKFQFTGFSEMWKEIQKSLTGGSMTEMARATADNTARTAAAAEQTRDAVNALGQKLNNVNPGLA